MQAELEANLSLTIEADGISDEHRWLLLSTMPAGVSRVWISPLDKGLSGSIVVMVRYAGASGLKSKQFVAKIGDSGKLERELHAIEEVVTPYVQGISPPVFRRGVTSSVLIQNLAALGNAASLESLRLVAMRHVELKGLINRLFTVRFENWYRLPCEANHAFKLSDLFLWYLKKAPPLDEIYPENWSELKKDVRAFSNSAWDPVSGAIEGLLAREIRSPQTPVHGDLHSQNILVENGHECWPIDFAWARLRSSPLLDLTMLECSLKFLAIPAQAELFSVLRLEEQLLLFPLTEPSIPRIPCGEQIGNVLRAVVELRRLAIESFGITIEDYLSALAIMSYCSSNHPQLNRPYILSALQLMLGKEGA
jgi:hypothetical protein